MKLPLRWAQSFAPFRCSPAEFEEKMTMSGSKVETYGSEADRMKNVVVGRIMQIARHPDADKLLVCQVDVGGGTVQIVTGAQNLKEGDLCPVALHGAKLPNGLEIKRGKLRGVESNGMLCSLAELGLTLNDFPNAVEDGILVLDRDDEAVPGTDAAAALGMDDYSFEFEITPNRPDCLSVRGLAREAAATFGVPFVDHIPSLPAGGGDIADSLRVKVESDDICQRYAAAMVDNVRIAPSPRWLRERLRLAGVRPINNIVDITNYVMLEYGHPMHAFDYAYVHGGSITVRRAAEGEGIMTLDGVQRALAPEMMIIADVEEPIAIAGVMGGEFSGVYETTRRVVFEAACFDGPSVRATSRKLGLRTESSGRFEKGLDPENALPALCRALELVAELDAGDIMGGILDDYPAPPVPRAIPFRPDEVNRLLGSSLPAEEMVRILRPLELRVEGELVHVPSFRADIIRDCDIAEEVARFVGYNNVPSTVLRGAASAMPTPRQRFERDVAALLCGYGFFECETFSFYSPAAFDKIRLAPASPLRNAVRIQNPLGEETSIMRTTALPSMMEVVGRNWAGSAAQAALFELAVEYLPAENPEELPTERQKAILAAYGPAWDYSALKGALEALLSSFGVGSFEMRRNTDEPSYHPGRCADIYVRPANGGKKAEMVRLGTIGEIHPQVAENYDVRPRVVVADILLDALYEARGGVPQYRPLPRFPAITRDLSLVADEGLPAAEMDSAIRRAGGALLEDLSLFDIYRGEGIPAGKKSLAYSLVLRDANTTLTDADADAVIQKALEALGGMGVSLRGAPL